MLKPKILIVEDDLDWLDIYRRCLGELDFTINVARKVGTALKLLEEQPYEVVITDLKMLGGPEQEVFGGFGVLEQAKGANPDIQVIVITGYGSADHALRAMSSGAYDYITKDRDLRKKLKFAVLGALEVRSFKKEMMEGKSIGDIDLDCDRIIGNSSSMQDLFEQMATAVDSDVNVLIHGEESTGKRLIAQTIHRRGRRNAGNFLVVDCGRLSESLLESELFGYEAGALYNVGEPRPGKFERANNGTIFLDSIGSLDLRLQKRLISVICDRIVERVGGQKAIPVDARIIASTDKDLKEMLAAQRFERRLYDALNEFTISTPQLRKRKDGDDIPALAAVFLERYSVGRHVTFSPDAIDLLRRYNYPGNVRELESIVKYALATCSEGIIKSEHLRPEIRFYQPHKRGRPGKQEETKDTDHILRVCPLNLGVCGKKSEIIRLYSPRRVFVDVPYASEYAEYEKTIRFVLEKNGLIPVLSKDYLETSVLLCNICKLIQTCKYGVTDISMTKSNSNVLYEMGLMHALGIPCAILKDHRTDMVADIQGLLFLEYFDAESFSKNLVRWIRSQIKEAGAPV